MLGRISIVSPPVHARRQAGSLHSAARRAVRADAAAESGCCNPRSCHRYRRPGASTRTQPGQAHQCRIAPANPPDCRAAAPSPRPCDLRRRANPHPLTPIEPVERRAPRRAVPPAGSSACHATTSSGFGWRDQWVSSGSLGRFSNLGRRERLMRVKVRTTQRITPCSSCDLSQAAPHPQT